MRIPPRLAVILLLAVLAPVLAQRESARGTRKNVSIKEMKFDPASIEVKVGDTVVWTNNDDRDHTVVGPEGTFKSENIKPGATYSYKFPKAGKFAYSCSYHPRMRGTVDVKEEEPARRG